MHLNYCGSRTDPICSSWGKPGRHGRRPGRLFTERVRMTALGWESLTKTELTVIGLVAEGLTNPQIANRLFVSAQTVKTHMKNVFRKLGVSSRAELAAAAVRRDVAG